GHAHRGTWRRVVGDDGRVPAGRTQRLHGLGPRSRTGPGDLRAGRQLALPARVRAPVQPEGHGGPGEGGARRRPARGRGAPPRVPHACPLLVGAPPHGFRAILTDVRPYLRPWIPVVSLAKGFERGSLLRMTQLIKDELPGHPPAVLTGPNLAKEIMAGQAAASVVATEDLAVARALQSVMQRGLFRIYTNHDVIGCELGGALKNVVAIATGVAQGLGVGDNTLSAVLCRGLAEVTRLGVAMGGEAVTFAGLAGMGDLIANCMSPMSRHRTLREQLGAGKTLEEILGATRTVAEGVGTAYTVHELSERHNLEMPVCREVYRVLNGEIPASQA